MRHKIRRHDLGDGVLYAVAETPGLTLLVVNDRELARRARGTWLRVAMRAVRARMARRSYRRVIR